MADAQPAGGHVDWVALEARYAGRPEFLERLVRIALDTLRGVAASLRAAAADRATLARTAHTLRGGADVIQALRVRDLAHALERAAGGDGGSLAAQAEALAAAVEGLEAELAERAARAARPAR
ncbi:MAG: Hpt domain-containing protein [Proteobacteria bacterium]|nr:Hpt domain-containing protein [Pseudomonadota bacterium]